jgi:GNAT-like C-terminal domain/N-acyltransferase N-terminal domain
VTGTQSVAAALPETDDDLVDDLLELTVPHQDVQDILAVRREVDADAALRTLFAAAVASLVAGMGEVERDEDEPPQAPPGGGRVGRYFPVLALTAALPVVRAYHRERGVPDSVSRHTLADLGRQMAVHHRRHGVGGLVSPGWLTLHFRGLLYQLGRLQFQRDRLGGRSGAAVRAAGLPYGTGDPCLALHVPDFRGPLTPAACDRSLMLARAFFAEHFADEPVGVALCHSWLLDPQLAEYLPGDSNIVRFQARFAPARPDGAGEPDDSDPVAFVFGDPGLPPDGLPGRTTLERAVGDHLRAGKHWYSGHGWFAL